MKESDKERSIANFFREEWAKLRPMTLKEKASYIWEYYKVHLLIIGLSLSLIISVGVSLYTEYKAGKIVFGIGIVNDSLAGDAIAEPLATGFAEYLGLAKGKERVHVNHGYSVNKGTSEEQAFLNILMFVDASTGDMDAAICQKDVLALYASDPEAWLDIRTFLDETTLEALSGRFCYAKDAEGNEFPCGLYLPDQSLNTDLSLTLKDPILVFLSAGQNRDYFDDLVYYLFDDELAE